MRRLPCRRKTSIRCLRDWLAIAIAIAIVSAGALAAGLLSLAATAAGTVKHTSAHGRSCGKIAADAQRYAVYARRSPVTCRVARYVIRHTLTTGPVEMGSPGQPPTGWQCGWNYYKFPHGATVRAGAACSRGSTEVLGDWRPHLLHCRDFTRASSAGTKFTAHDIWTYRLTCHTASNWIATFFSSLAKPSEEAYTGAGYGCGTVSGHDAGCVGTSGAGGQVNFELRPAGFARRSRACKGIHGPIAVWSRNVSCRFAIRFVEHVNTPQLYRQPKPYRYRGYRCNAHRNGVELYSRCVKRQRLIRFQTGP